MEVEMSTDCISHKAVRALLTIGNFAFNLSWC